MIDIKPGDWVLVEHPYIYDAYVVREVKSVTKSRALLLHHKSDRVDGWREEGQRARKAIVGVFPGQNAALAAVEPLKALYEKKLADEKAIKLAFHQASRALLDPQ